jgi:replicative DNA helicase
MPTEDKQKTTNPDVMKLQLELLRERVEKAKATAELKYDHYEGDFQAVSPKEKKRREDQYEDHLKTLRDLEESILNL